MLRKKYLAAISGGPDSMALLDMYKKHIIAVCVVNYHKRKDSDNDVNIVKEYCQKHKIKVYVKDIDKKIYQTHKSENFQSLARKLRYDFFLEVAKKENNYHLLVAHNLTDSWETAYMQEQRKSRSLYYGIKQKSNYKQLRIYRPLLCYQKDCLLRYCRTKHINFATDNTNELDIYERNRARKIIKSWSQEQLIKFIKRIKKYNRQHKKLANKVNKIFKQWVLENFNIHFFRDIDSKLQYYLIYEWLKLHDEKNNSYNKINEIIKYINSSNLNKQYRLENSKMIVKTNYELKII